jgi:hypothetical protein
MDSANSDFTVIESDADFEKKMDTANQNVVGTSSKVEEKQENSQALKVVQDLVEEKFNTLPIQETKSDEMDMEEFKKLVSDTADQMLKEIAEEEKTIRKEFKESRPQNDESAGSMMQKAVSMLVQWERMLEEGLIRIHFPAFKSLVIKNGVRFDNVNAFSGKNVTKYQFFKMKSVKRVVKICDAEEFKFLERKAQLPAKLNLQELSALLASLPELLSHFSKDEMNLYRCLMNVYYEIASKPYHKILVEKCISLRSS